MRVKQCRILVAKDTASLENKINKFFATISLASDANIEVVTERGDRNVAVFIFY